MLLKHPLSQTINAQALVRRHTHFARFVNTNFFPRSAAATGSFTTYCWLRACRVGKYGPQRHFHRLWTPFDAIVTMRP